MDASKLSVTVHVKPYQRFCLGLLVGLLLGLVVLKYQLKIVNTKWEEGLKEIGDKYINKIKRYGDLVESSQALAEKQQEQIIRIMDDYIRLKRRYEPRVPIPWELNGPVRMLLENNRVNLPRQIQENDGEGGCGPPIMPPTFPLEPKEKPDGR